MTINEKLLMIQSELKVPKSMRNSFGGYKYRTVDMIVEKLKPLLAKYEAILTLTDSIELIGDRYYVKAEARLEDTDGVSTMTVTAYAREQLERKKSDDSQLTGAASTYARKYALNGLFLLDDTADPDSYAGTESVDDDPAELDRQEAEELAAKERKPRKRPASAEPGIIQEPDDISKYDVIGKYVNPPETDEEEVPYENTLAEDTYFYIEATGNYVRKHAGDVAPEGGKVITKEEFVQGSAEIATRTSARRPRRARKER